MENKIDEQCRACIFFDGGCKSALLAGLRKELKKYTKDATSLIVAQRIGTIMNADKILVLDNGECVGMGTHKELLKSCDVYKQIALSQVTEEELENGTK